MKAMLTSWAIAALSSVVFSATYHVPDDYLTIQGAISAPGVANGDVIVVRTGTYMENIDFLGKAIMVTSENGPALTTIDGTQQGSVVTFENNEGAASVLEGFRIANGYYSAGGGVHCDYASPTITGNIITQNGAHNGGGIFCHSASPLISYNTITANTTSGQDGLGGGIHCQSNSSPTITGNQITSNAAPDLGQGGGIYCQTLSNPTVTNCLIAANTANDGGGICNNQVDMILTNNTIIDNLAVRHGGGFFCNASSLARIANTIFWGNLQFWGNELYIEAGSNTTLDYCDIQGGWPTGTGNIDADPLFWDAAGGDYHLSLGSPCINNGSNAIPGLPATDFEGDERIVDQVVDIGMDELKTRTLEVPEEFASVQAAITAARDGDEVVIAQGIYQENLDFLGRAIVVRGTDPGDEFIVARTIIDGTQQGSTVAFFHGEGVDSMLEGLTITGGNAVTGGGIYCAFASPTISNNLITGNSVYSTGFENGQGAGIYCFDASPVIVNNRIFDNAATNNSFGGGIACHQLSQPAITNNTITANVAATSGGGIYAPDAAPVVTNTILWNNQAPNGAQISGNNVVVTSCNVEGGWPGTGNIDADPLFVDAAGGDFHIPFTSPCKDGGDDLAPWLPATDPDGNARVFGAAADMGADEYARLLYHRGDVAPGAPIVIRVVGTPGLAVLLALGAGMQDPPQPTPYGDLYLTLPLLSQFPLGTLPAGGVLTVPANVPPQWQAGEERPFQALVGTMGNPASRLTNLMILEVQ